MFYSEHQKRATTIFEYLKNSSYLEDNFYRCLIKNDAISGEIDLFGYGCEIHHKEVEEIVKKIRGK